MANRARQYCSQILMYAVAIGKIDRDFTVDIKGSFDQKRKQNTSLHCSRMKYPNF